MKISIIIPCYLGNYRNAAGGREWKLIRAVESAMVQGYRPIEIIVVSDGCERTTEIMQEWLANNNASELVKTIQIPKQPAFSGNVRNAGIEIATGDVITYLDADDIFGFEHLKMIADGFNGHDWVWFNDMTLKRELFIERECNLKLGFCGTSNIAHKRTMKARWLSENRYAYDDWNFIQALKDESDNYAKIETPAYVVCHIPYKQGYDI